VAKLEYEIEDPWCQWVEDEFDLIPLKLTPEGRRGYPDRMVFLPSGRVFLVEFKRPGVNKARKLQQWVHEELGKLDHVVLVTNKIEEAKAAFKTAYEKACEERKRNLAARRTTARKR